MKKLGDLALTTEAKRTMVQRDSQGIPVVRQCQLLRLSRSSLYYRAQRAGAAEAYELRVLKRMWHGRYASRPPRATVLRRPLPPALETAPASAA